MFKIGTKHLFITSTNKIMFIIKKPFQMAEKPVTVGKINGTFR